MARISNLMSRALARLRAVYTAPEAMWQAPPEPPDPLKLAELLDRAADGAELGYPPAMQGLLRQAAVRLRQHHTAAQAALAAMTRARCAIPVNTPSNEEVAAGLQSAIQLLRRTLA